MINLIHDFTHVVVLFYIPKQLLPSYRFAIVALVVLIVAYKLFFLVCYIDEIDKHRLKFIQINHTSGLNHTKISIVIM